jgi:5'-deoxynucleotidase YfbR-like HD superfamily hydrolase
MNVHEPLTADWMETLSGRRFSPFDDEPDFELRDLVWGVARAQRYAGQFKEDVEHYSVAEHMVLMARWLMARERHRFDLDMDAGQFKEVVRCAATHDLPEGLLLDMVRPIKRHDAFYREAEARFAGARLHASATSPDKFA